MENSNKTIIVSGSKETIEEIHKVINEQTGSQSRLSESSNLAGDINTGVLLATISINALPIILGFIKDMLSRKKIGKIRIDDIEIENPTPEMVNELLKKR